MKILLFLLPVALLSGNLQFTYLSAARSPPAVARSAAEVYRKYCSSCHGLDGQAKTLKAKFNHARNIADPAWQNEVGDERIFNSIMNGRNVRGNMPAFSKKISEEEADALVTYVRGLKK
ncbi:MAG TPA: cytochrome c [Pyrinomonadaceae bacterium]|nr:cytochrome c [Pyrinomonadaceae bacterium]